MAHLGTVWKTEYVAEGAKTTDREFEEFAEIASRLTRLVSINASDPASQQGSSIAQLYSWAMRG